MESPKPASKENKQCQTNQFLLLDPPQKEDKIILKSFRIARTTFHENMNNPSSFLLQRALYSSFTCFINIELPKTKQRTWSMKHASFRILRKGGFSSLTQLDKNQFHHIILTFNFSFFLEIQCETVIISQMSKTSLPGTRIWFMEGQWVQSGCPDQRCI